MGDTTYIRPSQVVYLRSVTKRKMKTAFVLVLACLSVILVVGGKPSCDCDYHPGGCIISVSPPEGFKCRCVYKGAWTCGGYAVGCDPDEMDYCNGKCYGQKCCKLGGGDCQGYAK